jgi:hemerythrin-like domain-containing protein
VTIKKSWIYLTNSRKLTIHATCEEEILYPAAQETLKDPQLVFEAELEHSTARDLIAQIESQDPEDERYEATVHVLSEYVKHHVEEEENELFPLLKKSKLDLVAMGDSIRAKKESLSG